MEYTTIDYTTIINTTISQLDEFRGLLLADPELYEKLRSKIMFPDTYPVKNWIELMKNPRLAEIIRTVPKFVYPGVDQAIRKVKLLENKLTTLIFCYNVQLYLIFEDYLNYETFCIQLLRAGLLNDIKLGQIILDGKEHQVSFICANDDETWYHIYDQVAAHHGKHPSMLEIGQNRFQVSTAVRVSSFTNHESTLLGLMERFNVEITRIPTMVALTGDKYKTIKLDNDKLYKNPKSEHFNLNLANGVIDPVVPKKAISPTNDTIIDWIKLNPPSANQPATEYFQIYLNSGVQPTVKINIFGTLVRKAGIACGKNANNSVYNYVPKKKSKKNVDDTQSSKVGGSW